MGWALRQRDGQRQGQSGGWLHSPGAAAPRMEAPHRIRLVNRASACCRSADTASGDRCAVSSAARFAHSPALLRRRPLGITHPPSARPARGAAQKRPASPRRLHELGRTNSRLWLRCLLRTTRDQATAPGGLCVAAHSPR